MATTLEFPDGSRMSIAKGDILFFRNNFSEVAAAGDKKIYTFDPFAITVALRTPKSKEYDHGYFTRFHESSLPEDKEEREWIQSRAMSRRGTGIVKVPRERLDQLNAIRAAHYLTVSYGDQWDKLEYPWDPDQEGSGYWKMGWKESKRSCDLIRATLDGNINPLVELAREALASKSHWAPKRLMDCEIEDIVNYLEGHIGKAA